MKWALSPRVLPWLVAAIAAFVLALVHILQAYGWAPCELCLKERVPYWFAAPIAAGAGLAGLKSVKLPGALAAILMAGAALAFLVGAGLAIQHIGVEQHWWETSCSTGGPKNLSDLLNTLGKEPITMCDETRPFLFGITLPVYNLLVSLALAAAAASLPLRALLDRRREQKA